MQLDPIADFDHIPGLSTGAVPPLIRGTAALAHRSHDGAGLADLLAFIDRPASSAPERAALTLDQAQARALRFQPVEARRLQAEALAACRVFRVEDDLAVQSARPLRLLALFAPGDLMANTPLDFITRYLDVRLDLLYVAPEQQLPSVLPDHDVAFFAAGDYDEASLRRMSALHAAWPRPVLNAPSATARLARDVVADGLAAVPGMYSPAVMRASRGRLCAPEAARRILALLDAPALIRPVGSHAGQGLAMIADPSDLARYLEGTEAGEFFITRFVDYRDEAGLYRKYRVAVVEGRPLLCHMATSSHWMVHYLNAGMAENADRRAEEAAAMAVFDAEFAGRHRAAFAGLSAWMELDYFQLDCAEAPDGRLLVFEVDVAAIIHLMDSPDLFPYKRPQMLRVFAAFEAMLRRRAGSNDAGL